MRYSLAQSPAIRAGGKRSRHSIDTRKRYLAVIRVLAELDYGALMADSVCDAAIAGVIVRLAPAMDGGSAEGRAVAYVASLKRNAFPRWIRRHRNIVEAALHTGVHQ